MDSKLYTALLLIFLQALTFEGIIGDEELCISYCGNATGITCPSGYICTNWRCGYECHRNGKYQPDDCPMIKCVANFCPLGYKRYPNGCEGCTCANEAVIKAIAEGDYYIGAASILALPSLLLIPIIYAGLRTAGMLIDC